MKISSKLLFQRLIDQLQESDIGEKQALVRYLLSERLGLTWTDILLDKLIDPVDLSADIARLNQSEPIQYLVGRVEFGEVTFLCGPGALIPRPETEELFFRLRTLGPFNRILDIGTGTGCLAHSLSLAFPEAYVEAWDISSEALYWAERNKQHVQSQVNLRQQDIFQVPTSNTATWDLIVSNPPYVLPSEKSSMHPRVLKYEPDLALFVPEGDPLLFYRAITHFAQQKLEPQGILAFEINQRYGHEVVALVKSAGFQEVNLSQDIPGKDRMVLGIR